MSGRWSTGTSREPWFRQHPAVALAVAGVLYAGVLSVRLVAGGPVEAYSVFYAFPVALIAIAFGRRAGLAAGLVAVALTVAWALVDEVSLSPAAWVARVVPVLLLGLLLGDASDRLRDAEAETGRLEAGARLYREAIEINDSLVQGMAAARWSLEAGEMDVGLRALEGTIVQAQELVSDLIREAGMGGTDLTGIDSVSPPRAGHGS